MKRFIITLCLLSATPFLSHAQTVTTINARVLPTIWYSSLSAHADETVRIYSGIQNDSGTNFSGKAVFSVEGKVIGSVPFQSKSGSVEKVGLDWTAISGKSSVSVKISTNLDASRILVSDESDTSYYSVESNITLGSVTSTVKDSVVTIAEATAEHLDQVTEKLNSQLESFKKPEQTTVTAGRVLGTSTVASIASPENIAKTTTKAKNWAITALQFLLAHWRITSSVLGASVLAFVFLKR
jgi:flagellin-like hook-associated protein FlgL